MEYNHIDFQFKDGNVRYDSFRLNFYTEGLDRAERAIKALADERDVDRIDGAVILSEGKRPELVLLRHYRDGTSVTFDSEGNAVIPTETVVD